MKIKDLRLLHGVTSTIKLAKVEKDIATAIINNHMAAAKAVKEADADFEEAKKAIFNGLEDDQRKLNDLRDKYAAAKTDEEKSEIIAQLGKYADVVKAEQRMLDTYQQLQDKDVKIKLTMIELDKYIDALTAAKDDYSASDIEKSYIMIK